MAQLSRQPVDVSSTMEPVAADEFTAGDVGAVQNMRLVIDIGNNSTIEIPLRGKLVVHNGCGGAAAQAAAGADDDGGAVAHQAAAGGGMVSSSNKEHLNTKFGWLMTVAALFVQMAFQAALQPPTWIPANWFDQLLRHRKSGADVAPSSPATTSAPSNQDSAAAATTLTRDQARRVVLYVVGNTITFATALTILIALLMVNILPLRVTTISLPLMCTVLVLSSSCTYVFANSYGTHGEVLVACILVAYAVGTIINWFLGFPVTGLVLRRIARWSSSPWGRRIQVARD
ncbi:hypothetical protein ABZP36_013447 [Zizania latifolia]